MTNARQPAPPSGDTFFHATALGETVLVVGDHAVGGCVNGRHLMLDWWLLERPEPFDAEARRSGALPPRGCHAETGSVLVGPSVFRTKASGAHWDKARTECRRQMLDAWTRRAVAPEEPAPGAPGPR